MADLNNIGGLHYEMMKRCYNENSVAYKDYGAKGISVCDEWHDRENFRKWAIENGYTKGMRLERIDSQKGYDPTNCVFGIKMKKNSESNSQKVKKNKKIIDDKKRKSGIEGKYSNTRLYRIYVGMHTRCENKNHNHYKHYGGRGIKVCNRWSGKDGFFNFYKWAMNNGYDSNLTIDRIDCEKGYCPTNCRWATTKEQMNNRRNSRNYFYNEQIMNLADIAKLTGITYGKIKYEITKRNIQLMEPLEELISDLKNKI